MQASTTLIAETVAKTMPEMSANTTTMTQTAQNVSDRIDSMSTNIQTMSVGIVAMQRDMWSMNKTFNNPADSIFDSMIPWGNNNRGGSPGPLPFQRPVR